MIWSWLSPKRTRMATGQGPTKPEALDAALEEVKAAGQQSLAASRSLSDVIKEIRDADPKEGLKHVAGDD